MAWLHTSGSRRIFSSNQAAIGLAILLAAFLLLPSLALAAGQTTHIVIGEQAVKKAVDPALKEFLGPGNGLVDKDWFRSGSMYPDMADGYFKHIIDPDCDKKEPGTSWCKAGDNLSHGNQQGNPGFINAYIDEFNARCPDIFTELDSTDESAAQCRSILAFLLGMLNHDIGDTLIHSQYYFDEMVENCEFDVDTHQFGDTNLDICLAKMLNHTLVVQGLGTLLIEDATTAGNLIRFPIFSCPDGQFKNIPEEGEIPSCYKCPAGYEHNELMPVDMEGVCWDVKFATYKSYKVWDCPSDTFIGNPAGCYSCPANYTHVNIPPPVCNSFIKATSTGDDIKICDDGWFPGPVGDPPVGILCYSCPDGYIYTGLPYDEYGACILVEGGPRCDLIDIASLGYSVGGFPEGLVPPVNNEFMPTEVDRLGYDHSAQAYQDVTQFTNLQESQIDQFSPDSLYSSAEETLEMMKLEHFATSGDFVDDPYGCDWAYKHLVDGRGGINDSADLVARVLDTAWGALSTGQQLNVKRSGGLVYLVEVDGILEVCAGLDNCGFNLTVSKTGGGQGSVTGGGIDCGADCPNDKVWVAVSEGLPYPTVELKAEGESGSVFLGWSGDEDCADGQVTVDWDVKCTADFAPPPGELAPSLIASFEKDITDGSLVGSGAGNSARGRLKAFGNMLNAADDLIQAGDYTRACTLLTDAYNRVDGDAPPPDFVNGAAREEIRDMINRLLDVLAALGYSCG